LALEKLGTVFNQMSHPLPHTPRRMIVHPQSGNVILIATDHNSYTDESKQQRRRQMAEVIDIIKHCYIMIIGND
jgi:hypothetical protein